MTASAPRPAPDAPLPFAPAAADPRADAAALEAVLRRVRLYAERRAAWLRKLWREESAEPVASAITHAEMDALLADRDAPAAEAGWQAAEPSLHAVNAAIAAVDAALAADTTSRLATLLRLFALSPAERDLLHAALAVELDPALGRVYAYLHDHAARAYPTEALVARLFGHGRRSLWTAASPLRRWRIVTEQAVGPGEAPSLALDPPVRDWLSGHPHADDLLAAVAAPHAPAPPLPSWPVDEGVAFVERARADGGVRARLTVAGPDGAGRRTFAALVARALGLALTVVDVDRIDDADWPRAAVAAQRDALLNGTALAWAGARVPDRAWPALAGAPVQFAIVEPGRHPRPAAGVADHEIALPLPGVDERRVLWRDLVAGADRWPADALETLVLRHRVTPGEVVAVARHGAASPEEAADLVREHGRRSIGDLAEVMECPFQWDDLVIHEPLRRTLEDLLFEAQSRPTFWERGEARRLFPGGRGLLCLFSGPPGTGKTMAAQVIAANLGVDLVRIDLSSVISKYVGETSQNLERVLSRAARMDVVLLFDEADALFGRRTEVQDAHDRFANTDTSYLLQAIEQYPGVALLATNRKGDIDPAFIRRFRYVAEFRRPDVAERLRMWERVVGELAGAPRRHALAPGLAALAEGVESTGAQIKFAVLSGLFVAQREGEPLQLRHLVRGLERELLKDGRALSEREQERLLRHAR